MSIRKQEFYEGAALHLLARSGQIRSLRYAAPLFFVNDRTSVMLKYSTRARSPWGFTFTADEQRLLEKTAPDYRIVIGLICGSDGVAAITLQSFREIATIRESALHIACYRNHGEHYEVCGPNGALGRKVPPSNWQRILSAGGPQQ